MDLNCWVELYWEREGKKERIDKRFEIQDTICLVVQRITNQGLEHSNELELVHISQPPPVSSLSLNLFASFSNTIPLLHYNYPLSCFHTTPNTHFPYLTLVRPKPFNTHLLLSSLLLIHFLIYGQAKRLINFIRLTLVTVPYLYECTLPIPLSPAGLCPLPSWLKIPIPPFMRSY